MKSRFLIPVFLLFLVAAACGDGASDEPDPPAAAAVSTTAAEVAPATTRLPDSTTSTVSVESEDGDAGHGEFLPAASGEPEIEIEVILTEFAFDPATLVVAPDQTVRFVLINEGVVEHEFRLSEPHRIEEHLASGHDEDEDDHEETQDIFVLVDAGETRIIDVTFPDDVTLYTELACLVPGHYEAGMKGTISYTG